MPPSPFPEPSVDIRTFSQPNPAPEKTPGSHGVGPVIGSVIIVVLLILGALYFWGAALNHEKDARSQIPYIPSGTTTITVTQ